MGPYELVPLRPREEWDISTREAKRRRKAARVQQAATKLERAQVILERVAEFYGYALVLMREPNQSRQLSEARHIACYLIRKLTGLTYREIGPLFDRTHQAISHACREVSRKLARWPGGSTAIACPSSRSIHADSPPAHPVGARSRAAGRC